jgi:aflatoxin B1 aldehyde reductase
LVEVALRWIVHHSKINVTDQDAVIVGVSSLAHLKDNLAFLQKGPLDERLVQVIDSACLQAKRSCPPYFR